MRRESNIFSNAKLQGTQNGQNNQMLTKCSLTTYEYPQGVDDNSLKGWMYGPGEGGPIFRGRYLERSQESLPISVRIPYSPPPKKEFSPSLAK